MPLGLLVVTGYRDQPPADRPQQFDDTLPVAAESQRYCLTTGDQLFAAVSYALSAPGEDALAALRRSILSTEGLFEAPESMLAGELNDASRVRSAD
jgi:hypothetical protein